jgi:predicted phosphodiesterase
MKKRVTARKKKENRDGVLEDITTLPNSPSNCGDDHLGAAHASDEATETDNTEQCDKEIISDACVVADESTSRRLPDTVEDMIRDDRAENTLSEPDKKRQRMTEDEENDLNSVFFDQEDALLESAVADSFGQDDLVVAGQTNSMLEKLPEVTASNQVDLVVVETNVSEQVDAMVTGPEASEKIHANILESYDDLVEKARVIDARINYEDAVHPEEIRPDISEVETNDQEEEDEDEDMAADEIAPCDSRVEEDQDADTNACEIAVICRNDITFLIIGDTHFMASRSQETDIMSRNVLAVIRKLNTDIDHVILLGDVIDRLHWKSLKEATDWMWEIHVLKPMTVLVGNHEKPDHSHFQTEAHPYSAMMHWPQTNVIWTATHVVLNGMGFFMMPYVPDGRFREALETVPNCDALLADCHGIFAHQTFYRAKMNGITSSTGDRWDLSAPVIISGHIHEYAWVQANILYTGSAYQIKHGEPENNAVLLARFRHPAAPTLNPCQVRIKIHVHTSPNDATHKNAQLWQFQRIGIHVPVKRTEYVDIVNLADYKIKAGDDVSILRVIIRATKGELLVARNTSTFLKTLIRHPKVLVKYEITIPPPVVGSTSIEVLEARRQIPPSFASRMKQLSISRNFERAYARCFGLDDDTTHQESADLIESD